MNIPWKTEKQTQDEKREEDEARMRVGMASILLAQSKVGTLRPGRKALEDSK